VGFIEYIIVIQIGSDEDESDIVIYGENVIETSHAKISKPFIT
jgi:hypothetical protein